VVDRCCANCVQNPSCGVPPPRAPLIYRVIWWAGRRWLPAKILMWVDRKGAGQPRVPCQEHKEVFCYDIPGSATCLRSQCTVRPEFLPCRGCPGFKEGPRYVPLGRKKKFPRNP